MDQGFAFGPYCLQPAQRLLRRDGKPVPIRSRVLDILTALVARHDKIVTKDELIALVWPDTVVEENNLTVHVSALRKLLGDGIEGMRYIATVPGRGYRFVAPVESHVPAPVAPAPPPETHLPAPPPPGLPRELTPLVGRAEDVRHIIDGVERSELVTILGAGGIGKTRIALAVAQQICASFADGVAFVDLAPVDVLHLCRTIASALGIEPQGMTVLESIQRSLAEKQMLIILDNCEHLVDAVAATAEKLLRTCPNIRILATSREPLRIDGETLYGLAPLDVPPTAAIPVADLAAYPSTKLFLERARAALGTFEPSEQDAQAIAEICRSLDGIPLAIELAAARLRLMPPTQLAAQLGDVFSLLTGGRRTALPRQQTMKAAIDWSYRLLTAAEQDFFARLSVFAGCWTTAAAEAVAAGATTDAPAILERIGSLVDKSLLQVDHNSPQTRYRMLTLTRHFAADMLTETCAAEVWPRLGRWLLQSYRRAEDDWPTMSDKAWSHHYQPDLDNLRAGLAWAFGPKGDAALGIELVSHSEHVWTELSLVSELDRWFSLAVSRMTQSTPPDVAGRIWLGLCSWYASDHQSALDAGLKAADLLRTAGDTLGTGRALWRVAYRLLTPTDVAQAAPYLAESGRLLRSVTPSKALISWLRVAALAASYAGDLAAARRYLDEALSLAHALHTDRDVGFVLGGIAEIDFAAGAIDDAIANVAAALALPADPREKPTRFLRIAGAKATYLLAKGEIDAAGTLARDCLRTAHINDMRSEYLTNLGRLALVAAMKGDTEAAAHLYGFLSAREQSGSQPLLSSRFVHAQLRSRIEALIPLDRLERLRAEGARMTEDGVIAQALED